MKKHVLVALAISLVLSALAFGLATKGPGVALQDEKPNVRSESLRTWARKDGKAVATGRPTNLRRYNNVRTIAEESGAIVVGTVDSKTSQLLPPAEKFIVTDVQIRVQDVLKGTLLPGGVITVRTPGGRVDFGDGTWAEVNMPDFWKYPDVGKRYVLFLENRANGTFVLRGGPQGFFQITDEGKIQPQVRAEDELMRNYADKPLNSFLQEVRTAEK